MNQNLRRHQRPADLLKRTRHLGLEVSKNQDGTYTATVKGQPHIKASGPDEPKAIRAAHQEIEKQTASGKLTLNGKFV